MNDCNISVQGFEMAQATTSGLVPRLRTNNIDYNPATLIKKLAAKNGGSYNKFYIEAKLVQNTSLHLKEDFVPTNYTSNFQRNWRELVITTLQCCQHCQN